jgi:mannose-1-phosphate guanylyltransferase
MRHAVILAGGSGTRLWPASRQVRPKQFIAIARPDEPMIADAIAIGRTIAADRVLIVTAGDQVKATRAAAPGVEIIAEPTGRNTAAAIGLAGAILARRDPEAVIVVLPADQHVRDREGMAIALDACLTAVENDNTIALVGIPPTRPETGFGYLEMAAGPSDGVRRVLRFVEKPNATTAQQYLASGRLLWIACIFCMTARRLLIELDTHLPQIARAVRAIAADPTIASHEYAALPSISFDHGVMERVDRVVAIPASVGWNDVGSWAAIPAVRGIDRTGNTTIGEVIVIDGTGNVIVADGDVVIAAVGVSDLVIVKAGDAILVTRRDRAQDVRQVIEVLSARGLSRYL